MGFDIVASILCHLSTSEKVIDAYNSAKAGHINLNGDEVDVIADETTIQVLERYFLNDETAPVYECIAFETLESIFRNLRKADEQLMSALKDPGRSDREKEDEVQNASRTMCAELSRIRTLNQGELPHKELQRLWELFRCDAKAPQY